MGGATLVMFGTGAVAEIKILATQQLDRRKVIIIVVSLRLGLVLVTEVFAKTPVLVQNIFSSAAATAELMAMLLSLILPELPEKIIKVALKLVNPPSPPHGSSMRL